MEQNKLVILWLSAVRRAAIEMALSYARDSLLYGWWDAVELLLWGPPVEAAVTDETLLQELRLDMSVGVRVSACLDCAALYGAAPRLQEEGIDVRGLGAELTSLLKNCVPVLLI